jgi:hypothetical protein
VRGASKLLANTMFSYRGMGLSMVGVDCFVLCFILSFCSLGLAKTMFSYRGMGLSMVGRSLWSLHAVAICAWRLPAADLQHPAPGTFAGL